MRKRSGKKNEFLPTRPYIDNAVEKYLKNGGTIKTVKIEWDDTVISKFDHAMTNSPVGRIF